MKIREHEAKVIFLQSSIRIPKGCIIGKEDEFESYKKTLAGLGPDIVVKAQVDIGGRGKAGGVLMATQETAQATIEDLFSKKIAGLPVSRLLIEERLGILHEYYVSITIDRAAKMPVILFADTGGVDIEETAKKNPAALRRAYVYPLLSDVPQYIRRYLTGSAPAELGETINRLYQVFMARDALLAEINPLVTTKEGVYAADAKLIIDDNALFRQGIKENRDLTGRERLAEEQGFSFVELDGIIGVIGNGAGLTMATVDLITNSGGRAANFLDVGGGASRDRVSFAVRMLGEIPRVAVIVVNLLGGITRCDEVAQGIVDAGVTQKIYVRLAGTNEEEGRTILLTHGYEMLDTMEEVVTAAVRAVS